MRWREAEEPEAADCGAPADSWEWSHEREPRPRARSSAPMSLAEAQARAQACVSEAETLLSDQAERSRWQRQTRMAQARGSAMAASRAPPGSWPEPDWRLVAASTRGSDSFSMLSPEACARLRSQLWNSHMEVESRLRPLSTGATPGIVDARLLEKLELAGLVRCSENTFEWGDRVYVGSVFHLEAEFFVALCAVVDRGTERKIFMTNYFYITA